MKTFSCLATGIVVSALMFSASADNITIADGSTSPQSGYLWNAAWMGTNAEDNEVEPGCQTGQNWDLEAFLLNGTTLTVVSGYDLKNGFDGTAAGDLFVDVGGDAGYDYVYDIDWSGGTYRLFEIDGNGTIQNITMSPENTLNSASNPVGYVPAQGQNAPSYSLDYQAHIHSGQALVTATGDAAAEALKGANNWNGAFNDYHNIASFDVSQFSGTDATFHLTMSCGNDNLMGKSHIPVPEPASLSLILLGLLNLGGLMIARKKR